MIFYKIRLNSFPKAKFACSYCTDTYKNVIAYRENLIEICISSGEVEIEREGKKYYCPAQGVLLAMPDMYIKTRLIDTEQTYMQTVAVECDFEFERIVCDDIDEIKRIVSESDKELILPVCMALDDDYMDIEKLYTRLIDCYLTETAAGNMMVISIWSEIVARIDSEFRKRVLGERGGNTAEFYSRKALRYIEQHYKEKLTVQDIAKMLNISPNYLSAVVKKNTGKNLTEIIAKTKIYHARRLAYEEGLDCKHISDEVGVCNEKYLNKLFKKYYGTSIQKCAMIDHEISLYHDKPWEIEKFSGDVFGKEKD